MVNHIFHKFLVKNAPKMQNVQLFHGKFFMIYYNLRTLVLLDHVYSDCLQNVATNPKNTPFSGFDPWSILPYTRALSAPRITIIIQTENTTSFRSPYTNPNILHNSKDKKKCNNSRYTTNITIDPHIVTTHGHKSDIYTYILSLRI